MKPIAGKNQTEFNVDGVKFFRPLDDHTRKRDNDRKRKLTVYKDDGNGWLKIKESKLFAGRRQA